jgi:hypothetical protein
MSNFKTTERSLLAQMRFATTVRLIDNRAITPHEEAIRDRLTVLLVERGLAEAEKRSAA